MVGQVPIFLQGVGNWRKSGATAQSGDAPVRGHVSFPRQPTAARVIRKLADCPIIGGVKARSVIGNIDWLAGPEAKNRVH